MEASQTPTFAHRHDTGALSVGFRALEVASTDLEVGRAYRDIAGCHYDQGDVLAALEYSSRAVGYHYEALRTAQRVPGSLAVDERREHGISIWFASELTAVRAYQLERIGGRKAAEMYTQNASILFDQAAELLGAAC